MNGLGVSDVVAIISAALALVSLITSSVVIARQTKLQFEQVKGELDAEVIAWAGEALDAISHGVSLARGCGTIFAQPEFDRLADDVVTRLSSLTDRGRLHFPNEKPGSHGQHKAAAFRGYRPPVLDAVVFSLCQVECLKGAAAPDLAAAEFMVNCRRLLVSEVQNAIDPRRRNEIIKALAKGRQDDTKSSFDLALELGQELNGRHPNLPTIQAFLASRAKP
jgi:hypothetical protein